MFQSGFVAFLRHQRGNPVRDLIWVEKMILKKGFRPVRDGMIIPFSPFLPTFDAYGIMANTHAVPLGT